MKYPRRQWAMGNPASAAKVSFSRVPVSVPKCTYAFMVASKASTACWLDAEYAMPR
jgi:hypothetical protein